MIIDADGFYQGEFYKIDFCTVNGKYRELINKIISQYNVDWFVLSDIHIPFQDNFIIDKVLNYAQKRRDALECDEKLGCIINGDILNCDGWSIHINYKSQMVKEYTVEEEIALTKDFVLNRLRDIFDVIIIHGGNHENRARYKKKEMNEIFFWCEELNDVHFCDTTSSMLILDKYQIKDRYRKRWWITHQPIYRQNSVSTTKSIFKGVSPKSNIIHGHTHISSEAFSYDGLHLWIQSGCLCDKNKLMYKVKNPMTSAHAMVHGFLVINRDGVHEFYHGHKLYDLDGRIENVEYEIHLNDKIELVSQKNDEHKNILEQISKMINNKFSNNTEESKNVTVIDTQYGPVKIIGNTSNKSKLSIHDVVNIYLNNGIKLEIAKKYNISAGTVEHIHNKRSWKWLTDQIDEQINDEYLHKNDYKCAPYKLSYDKVKEIYLSSDDFTYKSLAEKYNVSSTTISKIKRGISYTELTKDLSSDDIKE